MQTGVSTLDKTLTMELLSTWRSFSFQVYLEAGVNRHRSREENEQWLIGKSHKLTSGSLEYSRSVPAIVLGDRKSLRKNANPRLDDY